MSDSGVEEPTNSTSDMSVSDLNLVHLEKMKDISTKNLSSDHFNLEQMKELMKLSMKLDHVKKISLESLKVQETTYANERGIKDDMIEVKIWTLNLYGEFKIEPSKTMKHELQELQGLASAIQKISKEKPQKHEKGEATNEKEEVLEDNDKSEEKDLMIATKDEDYCHLLAIELKKFNSSADSLEEGDSGKSEGEEIRNDYVKVSETLATNFARELAQDEIAQKEEIGQLKRETEEKLGMLTELDCKMEKEIENGEKGTKQALGQEEMIGTLKYLLQKNIEFAETAHKVMEDNISIRYSKKLAKESLELASDIKMIGDLIIDAV